MNQAIEIKNIQAIIDHHAIQNGAIVTESPIWVDIRPWGSCATIIAVIYIYNKLDINLNELKDYFIKECRLIQKNTAGILLSGILSDTLNLKSPTTTEKDKVIAVTLAKLAGIDDLNVLANK